jgi:hypothetical protein
LFKPFVKVLIAYSPSPLGDIRVLSEEEADARTCTLRLRAEDEVAAAAATLEVVRPMLRPG